MNEKDLLEEVEETMDDEEDYGSYSATRFPVINRVELSSTARSIIVNSILDFIWDTVPLYTSRRDNSWQQNFYRLEICITVDGCSAFLYKSSRGFKNQVVSTICATPCLQEFHQPRRDNNIYDIMDLSDAAFIADDVKQVLKHPEQFEFKSALQLFKRRYPQLSLMTEERNHWKVAWMYGSFCSPVRSITVDNNMPAYSIDIPLILEGKFTYVE